MCERLNNLRVNDLLIVQIIVVVLKFYYCYFDSKMALTNIYV